MSDGIYVEMMPYWAHMFTHIHILIHCDGAAFLPFEPWHAIVMSHMELPFDLKTLDGETNTCYSRDVNGIWAHECTYVKVCIYFYYVAWGRHLGLSFLAFIDHGLMYYSLACIKDAYEKSTFGYGSVCLHAQISGAIHGAIPSPSSI